LAEVKEEEVDWYKQTLRECFLKDRGLTFQNTPIGIDIEVGDNYAFEPVEYSIDTDK
jgi:hypothetical protein